jgi:hypothetical protein
VNFQNAWVDHICESLRTEPHRWKAEEDLLAREDDIRIGLGVFLLGLGRDCRALISVSVSPRGRDT